MFKKTVTGNNLKLITIPIPATKAVTVLFLVGTGSRYEEPRVAGISHFLEHMAFKGTVKRPTTLEISQALDAVGAQYNAFTGKEFTGYFVKVASAHLPLAIDVLSDIITNSIYDALEIEKERGVIIEELHMARDIPMSYVGDLFEEVLYGKDTPMGRDIIGQEKTIKAIEKKDFQNYLANYYFPENMVLAVAGNFQDAEVSRLIAKNFNSQVSKKEVEVSAPKEDQTKPNLFLYPKGTEQSHIKLGVRGYPFNHPEKFAIRVLDAILGASMSSRLFMEVREKRGLAYYVRSGVESYQDTGYFAAQAGVPHGKVAEAIKVILSEFAKLKTKSVPEEELRKAKENLKGRMILDFEDSETQADFYARQELLASKILTPEEVFKGFDAVTTSDIKRVANDIFMPKKLNLALIGPANKTEKLHKVLNL